MLLPEFGIGSELTMKYADNTDTSFLSNALQRYAHRQDTICTGRCTCLPSVTLYEVTSCADELTRREPCGRVLTYH